MPTRSSRGRATRRRQNYVGQAGDAPTTSRRRSVASKVVAPPRAATPSVAHIFLAMGGIMVGTVFLFVIWLVCSQYWGLSSSISVDSNKAFVTELSLTEKVGKHLLLNTTTVPTIIRIQDAASLRTQDPVLFKDAQDGDLVLMWPDKTVVYSETRDQLLAVLPVRIEAISPSQTTSTETTTVATTTAEINEQATIEVRNGTRQAGRAARFATILKERGFTVSKVRDANRKNYEQSLVIQMTDKPLPNTLKNLFDTFDIANGKLGSFSVASSTLERNVAADILIILGAD